MAAHSATEFIRMFSECFSAGDIDGLMELYEVDAVFPNHHGTYTGPEQIRPVLQGYIDSGARIEFNRQVAFETGDIALVQNGWTLTTSGGDTDVAPQIHDGVELRHVQSDEFFESSAGLQVFIRSIEVLGRQYD